MARPEKQEQKGPDVHEKEPMMSLFKRNKVWWADFSVNGQRFRVSLDTTDWREANSREKDKIAEPRARWVAEALKRELRNGDGANLFGGCGRGES
jgi:hypothetical protein